MKYLEKTLSCLKLPGVQQTTEFLNHPTIEAFCDDVNILTSSLSDLIMVDKAVAKFEQISGALLSRNKKCVIMGFGGWKNKGNWPLDYLKVVKEAKIFGIWILDSFRSIRKRNWDFRVDKFKKAVFSWTYRSFPSLASRVEVLKTYALSRIYYLASIIPITKNVVKTLEKVMGSFLWTGRLLRVTLKEVCNLREFGGLKMVCVMSMCNSLLLTQLFRMLKSSDMKSISHVTHWIGNSISDFLPTSSSSLQADNIPEYFSTFISLLDSSKNDDIIQISGWKRLTNRVIYLNHVKTFPKCKAELESGSSFERVWKLINLPVLSSSVRDTSYLLLHNKLPVIERLFRISINNDPYCLHCKDAVVCDLEHYFCSCVRISHIWIDIQSITNSLLGQNCSNSDLINFKWTKSINDNEAVWLIGNYLDLIWNLLYRKRVDFPKKEVVFGFLKFKFKEDQVGARIKMKQIPEMKL